MAARFAPAFATATAGQATRRAERAAFAGERDEELEATLRANGSGEARFEESTIEVAGNGGIPEGPPEAVTSFESFFPQALEGLEVGIEELIEGRGPRVAGPVNDRTGSGLRQWSGG